MALHGHTRLELTDVHTGQVRTIEHDNLVTDAVQKIISTFPELSMAGNIFYRATSASYTWYSLWQKFYGGLLLYDTALPEQTDCFFAPAAANLTGTARYGSVNTGTGTLRGSYNANESVLDYTNRELRLVYDFNTSQGNGTIAAVCLSNAESALLGGTALPGSLQEKKIPGGMDDFWGGGVSHIFPASVTVRNAHSGIGVPFLLDLETDTLWLAKLIHTTGESALQIRSMPAQMRSISLIQQSGSMRTSPVTLVKTIDLSGVMQSTSAAHSRVEYDPELGVLNVVCTPGNTVGTGESIRILQVNVQDFSTAACTFTNTLSQPLDGIVDSTASGASLLNGLVYRNRLFVRADASTLYSAPVEDPTDLQAIHTNGLSMNELYDWHDGKLYGGSTSCGCVLDTLEGQLLATELCPDPPGSCCTIHIRPATPVVLRGLVTGSAGLIYPAVRQPYLGTINNLSSPVVKTASQTMKVIYTLREATE